MTEAELSALVEEALGLGGWRWQHQRPARTKHGWRTAISGHKGWPDIYAVRAGKALALELKSAKGRLTIDQQRWLTELGSLGHSDDHLMVFVWRPKDWVGGLIDEVLA